jgi:hypothetical protein
MKQWTIRVLERLLHSMGWTPAVTEKIREVPSVEYVDRIVERIIEKEVPVERVVEKIVTVEKIVEVEKVIDREVRVPVDTFVDRIVQAPCEFCDGVPLHILKKSKLLIAELMAGGILSGEPHQSRGLSDDTDGASYQVRSMTGMPNTKLPHE